MTKPGRPSTVTPIILAALDAAPLHGMSIDDIAAAAQGHPRCTVKALLYRLRAEETLHTIGGHAGGKPWSHFFRTLERAKAGEAAARAMHVDVRPPKIPKGRPMVEIIGLIAAALDTAPLAGLTPQELATACGRPYEATRAAVRRMLHEGAAHALRGFTAAGHPWVRYFPSAEAAENGRAAAQAVVDAINLAYAASRPQKEPKPKRVRKQREAVSRDREIGDTRHRRAKPDEIVLSWSKRGMGAVPSRAKLQPTRAAEVVWPAHVQVQVCRPCDVERFRVSEPINDGFAAEWRRLRGE